MARGLTRHVQALGNLDVVKVSTPRSDPAGRRLFAQGFPRRSVLLLLDEIHQPETGSPPSVSIGTYFGNLGFQLGNLNGDRSGRVQGHLRRQRLIDGMDCSGHPMGR